MKKVTDDKRTCPYCGIEFIAIVANKKYCCTEHERKARKKIEWEQTKEKRKADPMYRRKRKPLQESFPCANCGAKIEPPYPANKKFCNVCSKDSKNTRVRNKNIDKPAVHIPEETKLVSWDRTKGGWYAASPDRKKKFFGIEIEEAIAKRDAWVRENKFIELVQEVDKLCNKYSYSISEFYGLLEPIVKK